jgi:hypothetical protein
LNLSAWTVEPKSSTNEIPGASGRLSGIIQRSAHSTNARYLRLVTSTNLRPTLSFLAAILDRIGRYESAATIAGFAVVSPLATAWTLELDTAITHLREVLGDQTYESLAREGETMTTAAMATYAYDQIDQA